MLPHKIFFYFNVVFKSLLSLTSYQCIYIYTTYNLGQKCVFLNTLIIDLSITSGKNYLERISFTEYNRNYLLAYLVCCVPMRQLRIKPQVNNKNIGTKLNNSKSIGINIRKCNITIFRAKPTANLQNSFINSKNENLVRRMFSFCWITIIRRQY